MGNSTISLQDTIDTIASRGSVNPEANPAGYNLTTCVAIGNDVMDALLAKRFNWKWNSNQARPFLTNLYQQDYPQIGLSSIGWLESCWAIDINSSTRPLPIKPMRVDRDLELTSAQTGRPLELCWMYNHQLFYGQWPGATQPYANPLGAAVPPPNGPMAFIDSNGNILTLTTFGITGATAPAAPAGSAEGATVNDGTCVWTVVDPNGQGFRLDAIPGGGPVWQLTPKFQQRAPKFTSLTQLINPIPDDFSHHFRRGYLAESHNYSSDPKAQAQYPALAQAWMLSMEEATAEADKEADSFMLVPATQVVGNAWGITRDPRNPGTPY